LLIFKISYYRKYRVAVPRGDKEESIAPLTAPAF